MLLSRKLFSLILMLVFLFQLGCIQEMTIQDRLLCLNLTSYSQPEVPKCNSQEDCLNLVEKNFSFEDEFFSSPVRERLHQYKNHIARSWLFYNRAMENVEEIYNICYNYNEILSISRQVNELNNNLIQTFSEIDSAAKHSFSILLLERADLENEQIELIKEENLFDDYIAINNNINELALGGSANNSESYVSSYFSAVESFNSLSQDLGFRKSIVLEETKFEFVDSINQELIKRIPDKTFYIPIMVDPITELIEYLRKFLTMREAVSVLQNSSTFDLLDSYNNFAGVKNSAVRKFAELMNSDHLHRKEIIERGKWLEENIELKLSSIEEKIASIDSTTYSSFDQNFLAELYLLLRQESKITTQGYSIRDMSKIKEDSKAQYLSLVQRKQRILDEKLFGYAGLGKRINSLKQLYMDALNLEDKIDFISSEVVSGLEILCDSRVDFIENEINNAEFSEEQILKAADLKSRLNYKINRYNSQQDTKEKLLLCKPIVKEYNLFKIALSNLEEYEREIGSAIDKCMSYLDSIFSLPNPNLDSYRINFERLESIDKPYENPNYIRDSCQHLKNNVDRIINQNPKVKKITENHSKSKDLLNYLLIIRDLSLESVSLSAVESFKKKLSEEGKYFNGPTINALVALPIIDELERSSEKLLDELKVEFLNSLRNYLIENAEVEFFTSEIPELNKEYETKIKLTFKNLFGEIDEKLQLQFRLPIQEPQLIYSSPNVRDFSFIGEELFINLDSLPLGPTVLVFDSNRILARSDEKTKLLFIDSDKAIIEKLLIINTEGDIAKLKVVVNISDFDRIREEEVLIYSKGRKLDYYFDDSIIFFVENIKDKQEIQVYYSIDRPLDYSIELLTQKEIDLNTIYYEYLISIKNNLMFSIEDTKISLPFTIQKNNIVASKLFTSSGELLKLDMLPIGKISFNIPFLPPNQSWYSYLSLTVKDYNSYWGSILNNIEGKLNLLKNSENDGVEFKAREFFEELNLLREGLDFKNSDSLNELHALANNVDELVRREDKLQENFSKYILLREQIDNEIQKRSSEIESLKNYAFEDDAKFLENVLDETKSFLKEAEYNEKSGDLNSAISDLFAARATLSDFKSKDLTELIISEKEEHMLAANVLFSICQKYSIPDKDYRESIISLDEKISRNVMIEDIASAKESLDILTTTIADFNNSINSSLKNSAEIVMEKVGLYNRLSKEIPDLLEQIDFILKDSAESDFSSASYISPISNSRLEELNLKFGRTDSVLLLEKINKFIEYFNKNNFLAALELVEEFEYELEENLSNFQSIHSELSKNLDKMKEDAVISFNSTLAKFENSDYDDAAKQNLEKAKEELEKGNYLKSIALSNSASALLSLKAFGNDFSIPFAIIPLFVIIGAALYFRYRKKNGEKIKARLQKMLRNY